MRICISCFFLVILGQSNSLTGPDIVDTWEWIQGTRLVGNVLSFENQNKITAKPPKGGAGDAGGLKIAKPPVFSDTEIVGGSAITGKGSSAIPKENILGINLYEILILKAKQKGSVSGWSRVPFKKGICSGYIMKQRWTHGYVDERTGLIASEDSSVDIKFDNLKIKEVGGVSEMTGSCTYKIELWKIGKKQSEKYEEKDVPVKFIASRRPAQPKPMVFSPQTLAELEDIRRNCKSESKLESIESKTSLVLNGKEITFDIRRGGSGAYTVSGNNPYINLPTRNDGFLSGLGYMEDMAHAANELGNIIFDGLDGKLDGNCMSPDGRRISQLEAEALSDKFTSDLMNYYLDPVKNPYPFSKYFPNDPLKRQAILDICPLKAPSPAFIDPSRIIKEFNKFKNIYEQRNNDLMDANELVKQGKIKEAKKLLEDNKRFAYICRIPDSAEFFANTQTPEPPK